MQKYDRPLSTRRTKSRGYLGILLLSLVCEAAFAGTVITVPSGGDLQGAIDRAIPGDTILLSPGSTYMGNFVLRAKPGDGTLPITITTSAPSTLPPVGTRISPAHAANLPKLRTPNSAPAIAAQSGTRGYVLRGIEVTVSPGVYVYDLISWAPTFPQDLASYPSDLRCDQCYVHGDAVVGGKRGFAFNGRNLTVANSWVFDFKSTSQDTQAIAGFSGPGPFTIENNYLEASGYPIIFGGAAPSVAGVIPTGIRVSRNHITRPLSWKGLWSVKNLLELKNARDVVVEGNVLENNWVSAQNGFAILFTVRTCEGGNYDWAVVENVTFVNNIVRNSPGGVNIMGKDNVRSACGGPAVAGRTANIDIRNNLLQDIGGRAIQILSGAEDITVNHNTIMNSGVFIMADGVASPRLTVQNNLVNRHDIVGNGTAVGIGTITKWFPGAIVRRNVLGAISTASGSRLYPTDNFFVENSSLVGFASYTGMAGSVARDFILSSGSLYRQSGTDGKDIGADIATIIDATAGVRDVNAATRDQLAAYSLVAQINSAQRLEVRWSASQAPLAIDQICAFVSDQVSPLWCSVPPAATGSASVPNVPARMTPGQYEFRYLRNGSPLSSSNIVSFLPPPQIIVQAWVDSAPQLVFEYSVAGPISSQDFLELTREGQSASVWRYFPGGVPGRTTVPMNLPAGSYRVSYKRILNGAIQPSSASVTVPVPFAIAPFALQTATLADGRVSVAWIAPTGRLTQDFIDLTNASNAIVYRIYPAGKASGTWTSPKALLAGTYSVVYVAAAGGTGGWLKSTSTVLTVSPKN